jgi:hypothetical protein
MAFLRRKGNSFYLVHNVRQRGKVKQLHLACLGDRPLITDDVIRQVSRENPNLDLDWNSLREQVNSQSELFDARSASVQKLLENLRSVNVDLAGLFPLQLNHPGTSRGTGDVANEILMQLRLLHAAVGVKLDQFRDASFRNPARRRNNRLRG